MYCKIEHAINLTKLWAPAEEGKKGHLPRGKTEKNERQVIN
jgi:hypothetical protein